MLNLIIGRAGTGKTALVQERIRNAMLAGETGLLLIVPEQYSHYAERQLCGYCGDALSLHGETLSFTRLCGRVFLELGYPSRFLDGGGQILVMHRAIESVAAKLQVFGAKGIRLELLESMLEAVKELKTYRIPASTLQQISSKVGQPLSGKLSDLALILSAYDSLLEVHGGDNTDMLEVLAEVIGESQTGETGHLFFDGFNDFTAQELHILDKLLQKDAEITVCLTYDPSDDNEVFDLPRKAAAQLRELASNHGVEVSEHVAVEARCNTEKSAQLIFNEKHLFSHEKAEYSGEPGAVSIYAAPTRYAECEVAANKVLELVRGGYRWRDVAVMARDWEQYGVICENVFEKYGIPFFSSGREDILDKPPVAHIDAALEIAALGWEYKAVFRYIKTGLAGLTADQYAELENYVLIWNIRGTMWTKEWTLPPSGYGGGDGGAKDADKEVLERLNALRRKIIQPVLKLRDGLRTGSEAASKLRALFTFMEDIELPKHLLDKAEELHRRAEPRLADEYTQLWDVIVGGMEQMHTILGTTDLTPSEFRKLFSLVMSRYDVGVIPVSLDRTAIGSMAMSRRRDIKCLIILGATDENMPMLSKGGGALSESEREELGTLGARIPAGLEARLCHEMNMLYSALTLPSEELVMIYPQSGGSRPSPLVKRLKQMFYIGELTQPEQSHLPAVLANIWEPDFEKNKQDMPAAAAIELYGTNLALSPSRVDKYYQCPYLHFLGSGLKLKPRIPAVFDASMAGTFMHYVLEGVTKELKRTVGFKDADEELCLNLSKRLIEGYIRDELFGFEGRNARFKYLFHRLEKNTLRVLSDMLGELKHSDFEPLEFELDILQLIEEARESGGSDDLTLPHINLRGIIDRIDGWKHGDRQYLRVVDYKTGKKAFNLSDVMYGRDMQMLVYLFAIGKYGAVRYGSEISPAGVLYVPARDVVLRAPRGSTDEDLIKLRSKELRRSGILLDDPAVINAMETSSSKQYIPVKSKADGTLYGDSLVTPSQVGLLSEHIARMLKKASSEILTGKIACNPFFKSESDNACTYCEYHCVCTFDPEDGGKRRYGSKIKMSEVWETLKAASDGAGAPLGGQQYEV
ncbi:MAG: PD-(D/E)XK nuclease family protein [Oscillospiraceae bacterium]|nr:PD-(D/E)XK nuclease family protein [Oscillospiraceae bacterium]